MEKNNCNNTNSKHSPDDTSTTVSSEIDKSMFRRSFIVPAINVPTKDCSKFVKIFKNHTFKAPRIQPVQKIKGNEDKRKILLESNLGKELQHLSETKKTMLQELPYELSSQEIEIGYEHMSVEEVLRQILPQNLDPITSFESVGHIAHVNLSKEHIPYRFLIGKVLIDKVPSLSMVVNKTGSINSKYRAFDMEIIGQRPDGKKDFDVEVKEHGIRYRFDYSQVFWNSRLATEHQRIPKLLTKHNVIADMFAGVGPFAIPAARNTGCITHANDLNPNSVEWLKTNVTLNRVQDKVYTYNMDGREFIKHLINNNIIFDTVLMNLPASAAEFLDVFINAFPEEWPQMPKIYCYTFVRGKETAHKEAIQIIGDFLFQDERYREHRSQFEENSDLSTYLVRDVAPNKFMVCVSFTFPSFLGYNAGTNTYTNTNTMTDNVSSTTIQNNDLKLNETDSSISTTPKKKHRSRTRTRTKLNKIKTLKSNSTQDENKLSNELNDIVDSSSESGEENIQPSTINRGRKRKREDTFSEEEEDDDISNEKKKQPIKKITKKERVEMMLTHSKYTRGDGPVSFPKPRKQRQSVSSFLEKIKERSANIETKTYREPQISADANHKITEEDQVVSSEALVELSDDEDDLELVIMPPKPQSTSNNEKETQLESQSKPESNNDKTLDEQPEDIIVGIQEGEDDSDNDQDDQPSDREPSAVNNDRRINTEDEDDLKLKPNNNSRLNSDNSNSTEISNNHEENEQQIENTLDPDTEFNVPYLGQGTLPSLDQENMSFDTMNENTTDNNDTEDNSTTDRSELLKESETNGDNRECKINKNNTAVTEDSNQIDKLSENDVSFNNNRDNTQSIENNEIETENYNANNENTVDDEMNEDYTLSETENENEEDSNDNNDNNDSLDKEMENNPEEEQYEENEEVEAFKNAERQDDDEYQDNATDNIEDPETPSRAIRRKTAQYRRAKAKIRGSRRGGIMQLKRLHHHSQKSPDKTNASLESTLNGEINKQGIFDSEDEEEFAQRHTERMKRRYTVRSTLSQDNLTQSSLPEESDTVEFSQDVIDSLSVDDVDDMNTNDFEMPPPSSSSSSSSNSNSNSNSQSSLQADVDAFRSPFQRTPKKRSLLRSSSIRSNRFAEFAANVKKNQEQNSKKVSPNNSPDSVVFRRKDSIKKKSSKRRTSDEMNELFKNIDSVSSQNSQHSNDM